jgi:VWFA-related protein
MDRRTLRPQGALLSILILGGALAARAAGPQAVQSTLPPVGVELVQVDVVVTDNEGRPVAGLTAADFDVREDGKPQAVAYFGAEGRAEDAVPAPALSKPLPLAEVIAAPARPAPPRSAVRQIVLAVDDLHIAPANMVAARAALKKFVDEQVDDDDRIALVTTGGSTGLSQELTRDREDLRRAIDRLSLIQQRRAQFDGVPHLSEYQAELIDRGDPEAIRVAVQEILHANPDLGEDLARLQAYQRAQSMLAQTMSYSEQALRTIEGVVAALAPVSGRKIVVLCSDGFLIGLGSTDTRHYDLRQIVDAATRSGVVLYALDTRGLVSEVPGGDASFEGPPVMTAPGGRESLQRRSVEALRDGMNALAADTGGLLVMNSNDLSFGLGRILQDSQHYYVLAYEPVNAKRDGKFRKIEVRLRGRSGLRVRTRAGYFAPDEKKLAQAAEAAASEPPVARRDRELAQGLVALFPLTGIPVRMVVDYIDLPPDGPRALIKAHVDVRGVAFEKTEHGHVAELDVAGAVFDERGERVSEITGETSRLNLPLENAQVLREQGLLYEKAMALAPGTYQVRLAVREGRASLLGSASEWVEIPDRNSRSLSLSSVFLKADDGHPQGDGGSAPPLLEDVQVEKRLKRPQGLHYVVYLYRSDAAALEAADVSVQAQVWREGRLIGVGPTHKVVFPEPGAPPPRQAERIATEPLDPGPYELRIVATDRATGQKETERVAFTLE